MLITETDMLLGSAIQLIKDIEKISFLGDRCECVKIHHMTNDWLRFANTLLSEKMEDQNDDN